MILKDWLALTNMDAAEFSRLSGVAHSPIWRAANNKSRISTASAILIENATNGLVSRCEAIWPEDYIDYDADGNRIMLKKPKRRENNECSGKL